VKDGWPDLSMNETSIHISDDNTTKYDMKGRKERDRASVNGSEDSNWSKGRVGFQYLRKEDPRISEPTTSSITEENTWR